MPSLEASAATAVWNFSVSVNVINDGDPLEDLMDRRQTHVAQPGIQNRLQPVEAVERYAAVAAPILANGDMTGAVCMVQPETGRCPPKGI